ncbi:hypothetical protein GVAV_001644 [Gurleya vavrai]
MTATIIFAIQKSATRKIADSDTILKVYEDPHSAFILHDDQFFLRQNRLYQMCKDANTHEEIFDLKYNKIMKTINHVKKLNSLLRQVNATFQIDKNVGKCFGNMYEFQVFGSQCKRLISLCFEWDKLQENAIREYFRCCFGANIHYNFCRHRNVMPEIDLD